MNKNIFFLWSIILISWISVDLHSAPPPNVLFIVADDLSARIGPAGYPGIQTPNLDALASKGMTFRRAYCQYPVCGPSRASFMSGLYPESTGILDNNADILNVRPGTPSLPSVFQKAGYWTAATGKVFHRSGVNPEEVWNKVTAFENEEMEMEKEARLAFEKENGPITEAKNRKLWKEISLKIAPQTRNQGLKGVGPGYGPTGLKEEQHGDGKNAIQVASWITQKEYGDHPFFIACGFHKPHIPFLAPDSYFSLYPKESIHFDLDPKEDWGDIPKIAQYGQYKDYGFPEPGSEDLGRRQELAQAYYACISFMDAQLGIVLKALKESGQWDNTIIIFIGDNGYLLGEHFMWGKVMLFEESDKVPMIVRVPQITNGAKSEGLVELLDLFPTLTELCSVKPPSQLQGRSLVPMLKDPKAPGKARAYTVVTRNDQLGRAIRFDHWRYTEWGTPDQNELYDYNKDPRERTNLAKNPEYAPVVNQARAVLAETVKNASEYKVAP